MNCRNLLDLFNKLLVALVVSVFVNPRAMAAPTAGAPARGGTAADRAAEREHKRLLGDFNRLRSDFARRNMIAERAIALGGKAPQVLLDSLDKELSPQIDGYGKALTKFAAGKETARGKKLDMDKVNSLRAQVLALRDDPNLTKERIIEVADPAVKELAGLLLPDQQALSAGSRGLLKQRERLMKYALVWEKLSSAVMQQQMADGEQQFSPPSFAAYLQSEEEQALQLATPMDEQTRQALAINAQLAAKLDPEEVRCVSACNLTRNLLGLSALVIDPALVETSRDHSRDMEKLEFFSHDSPVPGKATPWDRAKLFNTTASGENIAKGMSQGFAAHIGWFHSPGHFKNMMGNHKRIGVGKIGVHWTQMFGQ